MRIPPDVGQAIATTVAWFVMILALAWFVSLFGGGGGTGGYTPIQ